MTSDDQAMNLQDHKEKSTPLASSQGGVFHSQVNASKVANQIPGLNIRGRWIEEPSKVKREVLKFFRDRFKEVARERPVLECSNFKMLKDSDKEFLIEPFTVNEIKETVNDCGDDKAPGPDGLNMRFIKKFWGLFELDFVNVLNEFFEKGSISIGCGSSFITLVPKDKDPVELNNYRLINLIGIISKVISKVLANRMKKVIGTVISDSQSAFVKAYDNVNWNFLIATMSQMGFLNKWCMWIRGILESARSSILVNGSPTFEFQCSKGLRQGDPISPFLFIIVEVLSCMIEKARSEEEFSGIYIPNGPCVSHLFYADDAVILGEWSSSNIRNVVRILRVFNIFSGLKINLDKCNIFGIGVQPAELNSMASTVGCLASSLPFKYLGLMVGANMNRISNWKSVYDVFDARLAKWKAKLLSIGGRITLIKAILQSIPNYYFSLYKVLVQVVKDLEAKIRNFLWGGDDSVKKLHWVARDRVTLPKKYGGLGLSKLKNTSIALLSKWGWRFLVDKNRLWSQTIEALHKVRNKDDFLPCKKSLSGVWYNIVQVLNNTKVDGTPLRSFFKASVGNGRNTAFWLDPWISNRPLKDLYPRLFLLKMEKGCRVNSCFSENNQLIWRWKRLITSEDEVNELVNLCSMLVTVSLNQKQDSWLWNGAEDREFSVNAVKKLLDSVRIRPDIYVPEECNWIPKKCSIFIWKAEMGRIATMDKLRIRNIGGGDAGCSLCGEVDESIEHIFTNCSYALMLWAFLSSWCKCQNLLVFSFRDLIEAHNHVGLIGRKKEVVKGLIRIGCWCLWRMRNDVKFNNKSANLEAITREVCIMAEEFYNTFFNAFTSDSSERTNIESHDLELQKQSKMTGSSHQENVGLYYKGSVPSEKGGRKTKREQHITVERERGGGGERRRRQQRRNGGGVELTWTWTWGAGHIDIDGTEYRLTSFIGTQLPSIPSMAEGIIVQPFVADGTSDDFLMQKGRKTKREQHITVERERGGGGERRRRQQRRNGGGVELTWTWTWGAGHIDIDGTEYRLTSFIGTQLPSIPSMAEGIIVQPFVADGTSDDFLMQKSIFVGSDLTEIFIGNHVPGK
ncbi:uncharacterized protein LOC110927588 [Helianthus annuus]|uniref:uncharacterized protein LOC110927588 n=1 Tax=Helianthus annuus TaxID=4232 RepID=UPI001653284D|nr:uncharacterized protein LOC110927588 [Helianthus annuus]